MKPLKDIRYYESNVIPGPGMPTPSSSKSVARIPKASHRIGSRISCMLHAKGFSVGDYDHIYVVFTTAIPERQIVATNFGNEHWFKYVAYGISESFKDCQDAEKDNFIQSATIDVVAYLAPEQNEIVKEVSALLLEHGDRARILRSFKETSKYIFNVWFDVPAWREQAYLYFTALEKSSGLMLEAPPLPLRNFEDAFPLVSSLSVVNEHLKITPRASFKAKLSVSKYPSPIQIPLSEFAAQPFAAGRRP